MARSIELVKEAAVGAHTGDTWAGDTWAGDPWAGDPWAPNPGPRVERLWHALTTRPAASATDDIAPVFDVATLADLCGDIAPDALTAILTSFVDDLSHRLDRIAAATPTANLRIIAFEGHALSGCSQTFGALRLALVCRGIEQVVEDGDTEEALALARSLGRIGAETLNALSAYRRVG